MYELICEKKDCVLVYKFYSESDRAEFLKRRAKNKYVFIDSKINEIITYEIRWLPWKK